MKTFLLAVLLVIVLVQPALASAGQPPAQTTPVPIQTAASSGGFPWLALLVFLIPLGIMLYKSRGKKEPDIKSSACMPIIDEKKSPFAPQDDQNG